MLRCGFRTGYVEFVNLDPTVMGHVYTLFSTDSCPPVLGQIIVDVMARPPQPGDPSYPTFSEVSGWSVWSNNTYLLH